MKIKFIFILLLACSACSNTYKVPVVKKGEKAEKTIVSHTSIPLKPLAPMKPKSHYQVKRGDTIFTIAWRFEIDPDELAIANNITDNKLSLGQTLNLRTEEIKKRSLDVEGKKSSVTRQQIPAKNNKSEKQLSRDIKKQKKTQSSKSKLKKTDEAKPIKRNSNNKKLNKADEPNVKRSSEKLELAISTSKTEKLKSLSKPVTPQKKRIGTWTWPTDSPLISKYSKSSRLSRSLQFSGSLGQPVKAASSGRVVYAGDGLIGFGNLIIISHPERYLSAYGHNQKLNVSVGDKVNEGDVVAYMGRTGTDRVKLHFEIRKNGTPINPVKLLPKR